jgi:hypothetical protein
MSKRKAGASIDAPAFFLNQHAMVAELIGAEALTLHGGGKVPFCERTGIPFIYDVHHHRCNFDGMPVTEATRRAIQERTA